MSISKKYTAPTILCLYAWEVIKANTSLTTADYGNKVPIVPGGQEPDFLQYDKPFMVFGASEDPSSNNGSVRGGTLVFAIYADNDGDIHELTNILVSAFERHDASAADINFWTSKTAGLIGIRFTTTMIAFGEAPGPVDQEGGRKAGTLTIKYSCVTNYNVTTRV